MRKGTKTSPERPLDTGISAGVYTMRGRAYRQYELPLFLLKIPGEERASAQAVSTASLQCHLRVGATLLGD